MRVDAEPIASVGELLEKLRVPVGNVRWIAVELRYLGIHSEEPGDASTLRPRGRMELIADSRAEFGHRFEAEPPFGR
jgi:hypothetical protein